MLWFTIASITTWANITASYALMPPQNPLLENYDLRLQNKPAGQALAPEQTSVLKARVEELNISFHNIFGTPDYISSRAGFLTGPQGKGVSVTAAFANAIPDDDKYKPLKAFLNEHSGLFGYDSSILNSAIVNRDYVTEHNGLRTVVYQQQLNGISIFESILKTHITKNGELVNVYTSFLPNPSDAAAAGAKNYKALLNNPGISPAQAVVISALDVGEKGIEIKDVTPITEAIGNDRQQRLSARPFLKGDVYVKLVWLPLNSSVMRLCWQVISVSKSRNQMFLHIVDAEDGKIYIRRNLTSYISDATYNVFVKESPSPFTPGHPIPLTNQPPYASRVLLTLSAINTNASPNGWIDDGNNETIGNNVDSHLDWNDDDQPDLPRPQGNPFRVFNFPLDFTQDPTNYSSAAVVQNFYYINWYHDKLYELGFTEAAGNFQQNNFGRGGIEGDPVIADVQDGGGYNNTFMMTPPDGIPARMTMLLFNGPTPMRDSAFDAEVVLHEYTHGLSTRLVGGGVGIWALQTSGMGEGWSDFYPLAMFSEPSDRVDGCYPMGGYITYLMAPGFMENYYFGIRRYPYSTDMTKNPLTFKDIDPTQASTHPGIPMSPLYNWYTPQWADEVHFQGEFWCSVLWELRANLIKKHGFDIGNRMILQIVTDAMKLCPSNPTYIEARDAIILADQINNNGNNYSELWAGFAKRGLGGAATAPDSMTTVGVVESYDVPGLAMVNYLIDDSVTGNNNGNVDPNECIEMDILIRNGNTIPASGVIATLSTTNTNVVVVEPTATYPNIQPFSSALNRTPFRFYTLPTLPCGSSINFMLVIQSGLEMRTNYFQVRSGFISLAPASFSNNTVYPIPDNNLIGISSPVTVSGIYQPIGKVTVSLHLTHTYVGDLSIDLIAPDGTAVKLVDKRGGFGTGFGVGCESGSRTVFDDRALTPIGSGRSPFVGTFRPELPLSVLGGKMGTNVNGTWRLRVVDTAQQDTGNLMCWTLNIYPVTCTDGGGDCAGDLSITGTALPSPVLVNSNLTYSLIITNRRPIPASGVVITNIIPTNVNLISYSASQGTNLYTNGMLIFYLGTIPNRARVTAEVVVQPIEPGILTNRFDVYAVSGDRNPADNAAIFSTLVVLPSPLIRASSARLVSESFSPPTRGIESGETVTVNFGLQNIGVVASTNITATLLSTNGVIAVTTSQNYGVIEPLGVQEVTRPFTFTAIGNPGTPVYAILRVYDGSVYLGDIAYRFILGASATFANPLQIIINDGGIATPYPSTIQVTEMVGVISRVTVTLSKVSHNFPDDLDILLVSPGGEKIMLMSDAGGGNALYNRTITFDSHTSEAVPDEGAIGTTPYLPGNYQPVEIMPLPAPSSGYVASFVPVMATPANGVWQLYVLDDTPVDGGVINGGWSLSINTVVPVSSNANLALSASQFPSNPVVGGTITYTMTVTNSGLDTATGVILSNQLAPNLRFVSATASRGTFTNIGNTVIFDIGSIEVGSNAVLTVNAVGVSPGVATFSAAVSANEEDLATNNNTVQISAVVINPRADVGILLWRIPPTVVLQQPLTYTVIITNSGPDIAPAVVLTNGLPLSFRFVGATATGGAITNAGNNVIWNVGDLQAGGYAIVAITVQPEAVGIIHNQFALTTTADDENLLNNNVSVQSEVVPPSPSIVSAGAALTAESSPAPDEAIEPGETVTLNIAFRNNGTAPTTNLIVRLLEMNGVILSAGEQVQTYGVLTPGGASVVRPFTFTVSPTNRNSITLVFNVVDGGADLGNVTLTLPLSTLQIYSNSGIIVVPQFGSATPYPSTILVTNAPQNFERVTVTLNGLTHQFVSDLDILLVSPGGQKIVLMSDAGEGTGVENVTLTFDDTASTTLPPASKIVSGTYRPSNFAPDDTFNSPAPAGPYSGSLSVLQGSNPNGIWSLYIVDDSGGDSGRIEGGWSLNFYSRQLIPSATDLSVSATSSPETVQLGESATIAVTVQNHGPSDATGIMLTNILPTGFYISSIQTTAESVSRLGELVTVNIGVLASGATTTLTIVGMPTVSGTQTNYITVTGAQNDPNLNNNTALATISVSRPQLKILRDGDNVVLSWSAFASGYILESSADLSDPTGWQPIDLPVIVVDGMNYVTKPIETTGAKYFRLRSP